MIFCYLYQVRHSEDLCRVLCAHAPLRRGGAAPSHSPAGGGATPRPLFFRCALRAPLARAALPWATPTAWGCAPTPHGVCRFARFARVRSRVCFLLSCLPFPLRLGHSPPPLIRGERRLPWDFFAKQKALPFQVRLLRIHPRSRSSTPLRGCHGQCIHPCGGGTRRAFHTHGMSALSL